MINPPNPDDLQWKTKPDPEQVGWYPANVVKGPELLSYWNGERWSVGIHMMALPGSAGKAAESLRDERECVYWAEPWWTPEVSTPKNGLKSWRAEFYPVEAKHVPEQKALAHSLQKWVGLLPENLERHGVMHEPGWRELRGNSVEEDFTIGSSSCALCVYHYEDSCKTCPIAIARDGVPCDSPDFKTDRVSPWARMIRDGNPRPMIQLLASALTIEK